MKLLRNKNTGETFQPFEFEILDVATKDTESLDSVLHGCGFGDLDYSNSIAYSPVALRDEANALLDVGIYNGYDDPEFVRLALEWCEKTATDQQLNYIASCILASDDAWSAYKKNFLEELLPYVRENGMDVPPAA